MELVYQVKDGERSPHLALTYKGQEMAGRIIETAEILDSEEFE